MTLRELSLPSGDVMPEHGVAMAMRWTTQRGSRRTAIHNAKAMPMSDGLFPDDLGKADATTAIRNAIATATPTTTASAVQSHGTRTVDLGGALGNAAFSPLSSI